MEKPQRIAVLGAGNGGHAIAADLSLAGYEVKLFNRWPSPIEAILERGGIEITGEGIYGEGFAKLKKATTDMKEAIDGVDLIIVVVPAYAHEFMIEKCAPYLEDEQIIVLTPGTGGSLEFVKVFREMGVKKDVAFAETSTLPYGCRLVAPAKVTVHIAAKLLPLGVFPSKNTEEVVRVFKDLYPQTVPCKNVLEAALNNPNPVMHPTATLLNVGRIEYSKGEFYLYKEGVTVSVSKVLDAVHEERATLCDALDFKIYSCSEPLTELDRVIRMGLLFGAKSIEAGIRMKGPSSVHDRYVKEDVPYGLVFFSSIGDMLDVPMPVTKSIITLFSVINQKNYFKEGRSLEKLGLSSLTSNKLNRFLAEGKKQ